MAEQSKAFDVFLVTTGDAPFFTTGLNKIDTVFYPNGSTCESVRRDLINHDGYDSQIIVKRGDR